MRSILQLTIAITLLCGTRSAGQAQYMYLDANQDGIHDSGDALEANGTPTTVDVYLITDRNRDGSGADQHPNRIPTGQGGYD